MASTSKKWFIGCGIGCGLFILITAVIGGGIFFAVKDVIKDGKAIDESNDAMVEAFGSPDEFIPSPDGSIAPERMEIFLAVRDETALVRNKMAGILNTLDEEKEEGGASVLAKIKAGMTMVPAILAYINDRNEVLLSQGMGDGEYTYIYTLSYFSYLDKDLTDGPSFQMSGDDDGEGSGMSWKVNTNSNKKKVRKKREKNIRRQMHKLQLSFLMNQMAALEGKPETDPELLALLEKERAAMTSSRGRLLWEEGLPEPIEASLAPYADRLDQSYLPILNVIEVGLANSN